jgi:hypothetical protein
LERIFDSSDAAIIKAVSGMGRGNNTVKVVRYDGTVYITVTRPEGHPGKIQETVCKHLRNRLLSEEVAVLICPIFKNFRCDALVREIGSDRFDRRPIQAIPERLGVF